MLRSRSIAVLSASLAAALVAVGFVSPVRAQPAPPPAVTPPPAGAEEPVDPDDAEPAPAAELWAPDGSPPVNPVAADAPPAAPTPPPPPAPPAPGGGSFMDTRLSFTCTHEDVLRDQTTLPSAPGFRCGRPNSLGVLFFDNYDTRYSGFETLSHLALYKHYDRGHWDVEAGLVIRFNEFAEDNIKLSDGGTYIRVGWLFNDQRDEAGKPVSRNGVSFVAFPVSSDRFRLGYSYRISWGGSPEFFKANPDAPGSTGKNPESVPGAKLQVDLGPVYAFVGMKSSLLLDPEINEQRAVRAFLFGGGVDVSDMLRIDFNGGVFDRGGNEAQDVLGEPVTLYGGSVQIAVHDGMPVGSSIDYALYRNSPEAIGRLFKKEQYPGGLAWLVSAEATTIFQTLKDPESTGSTTTQMGFAADLNARAKLNFTRFKFDFMIRDLAYILHSIPSLPTYWDFPASYSVTPEIFVSAGVDHYFPGPALTLGATFGLDIPATLESPIGIDGDLTGSSTLVVRNEASRSVLPRGESIAPIYAFKGSAKLEFAESFAAIGEVYFQYDPNTVKYTRDGAEETFSPEFANFEQLGFNITLQARF